MERAAFAQKGQLGSQAGAERHGGRQACVVAHACHLPAQRQLQTQPSSGSMLAARALLRLLSAPLLMHAGKALGFLSRWLQAHPSYRDAAAAAGPPPDSSQALSHTSR